VSVVQSDIKPTPLVLQYWTTKHNNFHSAQNRFFEGNQVPGLFSERLKTFKSGFARLFPRFLGLNNFYMPIWGQFLLRMASIDIMAPCPTLWCTFCFWTTHSAAFPVNHCRYVSMNLHDWLKKRWITLTGHTLRHSCATVFASSNLVL
jgi:hypothetical protein